MFNIVIHTVASLWGWVGVWPLGFGFDLFRLGGFLSLAHPRARVAAFFIRTHSQRETWGWFYSTPHGFAYCESSSERWVGSPVGQYLSSRPSSVVPWNRASPLTPAYLSRAPRSYCDSPPWPLHGAFPRRRKACLPRRLVYCL